METIGNLEYPDRGSFKDALLVAEEALKYGGTIPNDKAAEKLGYSIKSARGISGYIYKRLDDVCMFGITTRSRGVIQATDLAVKALHPSDSAEAAEGKAEAIRNIPIIAQAYEQWNGQIPAETAFPAKIAQIAGVTWIEAQKHAESLQKLFGETFPYLKEAPEPKKGPPIERRKGGEPLDMEIEVPPTGPALVLSAVARDLNFKEKYPFSSEGFEDLERLIEYLKTRIPEDKAKKPKAGGANQQPKEE